MALTFDDGPSESTPQILEILARYGAPATFFQCGANVERLPEIARDVAAAGHEIGNHSYTHPYLFLRSPARHRMSCGAPRRPSKHATGAQPRLVPRALMAFAGSECGAAQRRLQLAGVMWTAIGYDWSLRADEVVARMAAAASNGAILCLHDGRELREKPDIRTTVEAVRRLVPLLLDRGIQFETVSATHMSDELIQRVLKVIAASKRIPPETVTIDSEFQAAGNRFHGRGRNPLRARERVRHQHSRRRRAHRATTCATCAPASRNWSPPRSGRAGRPVDATRRHHRLGRDQRAGPQRAEFADALRAGRCGIGPI